MIKAPRLAGDRNPIAEKIIVQNDIQSNWAPVPQHTDNRRGEKDGGRKISAWTNFHPFSSRSSAFSSSVANRLYRARSCLKFLSKIATTIAESTTTMTRLFAMDSQCTLAGMALSMLKYISQ